MICKEGNLVSNGEQKYIQKYILPIAHQVNNFLVIRN